MAKTSKKRMRATWLQVHKWIGLTLALLIIPISLTGAALVWHDWLDAQLEPQRHQSIAPAGLPASAYADAARAILSSEERITTIRFEGDKPVMVVASKPAKNESARPERTNVWLNPRDARVIDQSPASGGLVQVMHVLHGSLMVPGWGRTIVGWVGAFMFVSCLTGIWLWWPLSGSVTTGLRWRRRNTVNANIHYLAGFWIMIPLAMLTFTGAWISFPKVFGMFESRPAPSQQDRAAAQRARPLAETSTTVDQALQAPAPHATGPVSAIAWPTDRKAEWKISYERPVAPAEVTVDDATRVAEPPRPPQQETLARTMRRWHDGTGMGPVWQTIIFLGGIVPAILSVTGIIIWWRARQPRTRSRDYKKNSATLQAAE